MSVAGVGLALDCPLDLGDPFVRHGFSGGAPAARAKAGIPGAPRSKEEIARFFDGLDLVEPGLIPVIRWRPDGTADRHDDVPHWGGVARIASASTP